MAIFSLRWIRKLFQSPSYQNVHLSELSDSWTHKRIKLDRQHLLVDCVVYPKYRLKEYSQYCWDSSELVEMFGLEKNSKIETEIDFYNRNPKYMMRGLDVNYDHIFISCGGEIFEMTDSNSLYTEMLPRYVLHFWRGIITKKSDWSDLLSDLQSSKVTLKFPAILVFEKDKDSKIPGSGNLRIYSDIPNLSLLMHFLDSKQLI